MTLGPADAYRKRCSKCEVVKDFDAFHRRKGTIDGHQYHCKECVRKQRAARGRQTRKAKETGDRESLWLRIPADLKQDIADHAAHQNASLNAIAEALLVLGLKRVGPAPPERFGD